MDGVFQLQLLPDTLSFENFPSGRSFWVVNRIRCFVFNFHRDTWTVTSVLSGSTVARFDNVVVIYISIIPLYRLFHPNGAGNISNSTWILSNNIFASRLFFLQLLRSPKILVFFFSVGGSGGETFQMQSEWYRRKGKIFSSQNYFLWPPKIILDSDMISQTLKLTLYNTVKLKFAYPFIYILYSTLHLSVACNSNCSSREQKEFRITGG